MTRQVQKESYLSCVSVEKNFGSVICASLCRYGGARKGKRNSKFQEQPEVG